MAFEFYDHDYTMFGAAVQKEYLIAMLGCQVVFVAVVRGCKLPTEVLEVRVFHCSPMGTTVRWAHQSLGQGNGQGSRARQRDWEKEAGQWLRGKVWFCVGA